MFHPVSTYRIQFHEGFTFNDLENIISYLQRLGIGTVYASPIFDSVPGSTHGYDAIHPHQINPRIGSLEQFREIRKILSGNHIGWLQDIVPNHMAFDPRNPWLSDVLKKGPSSEYAAFFDIQWDHPDAQGKLMAPFLGGSLEELSDLSLQCNDGSLCLKVYDQFYPCNDATTNLVLEKMNELHDSVAHALQKDGLQKLMNDDQFAQQFHQTLEVLNQDKQKLLEIARLQHYRLCHWQETDQRINYRRFFTVNGLICLNIQDEKIFDHFHGFIKQLLDEKLLNGLRVDHIDGLLDPTQYLNRLRLLAGDQIYVVVEKILHADEDLPSNWKIEGNTGYDFLAMVNNLMTSSEHEELLHRFYSGISASRSSFEQQLRDKKAMILFQHMEGELDNLCRLLPDLAGEHQLSHEIIKKTIGLFLVHCPVYRYYGNQFPLSHEETTQLDSLFQRLRETEQELTPAIDLLRRILLEDPNHEGFADHDRLRFFYQRCMQLSGPLMAKGLEDTLMYTYIPLLAHNEVGDSPDALGYTNSDFHKRMKHRQEMWPMSINATATHDTKRGEDARARLNVLSELTPQWIELVEEWLKTAPDFPDRNDIYFIYQTLIGHYSMPGTGDPNFADRLEEYLTKALREAKRHSNWASPDEDYEKDAVSYARSLLDSDVFLQQFLPFQKIVADHGIMNSLLQMLLKFTCPGIPDVYQGTELWDLSFVDPDNRRPVDYALREQLLSDIEQKSFSELWNDRYSGAIKLWMMEKLFKLRRQHRDLLSEGEYIPLQVKGKYQRHIIAFARKHRQTILIIAAPVCTATLCGIQQKDIQNIDWEDTRIVLPDDILSAGEDLISLQKAALVEQLLLRELFAERPFAIIRGNAIPNERGAGLLLHLSSLPSAFGIGDMGPEARNFADLLERSYQKYWQLLPLHPVEEGQGYSPYSATSGMAGNTWFISAELLVEDGLLSQEDLEDHFLPQQGISDYSAAASIKATLLAKAWEKFLQQSDIPLHEEWKIFCEKEKYWLNDFACFTILKHLHQSQPWYEWPDHFRLRDEQALLQLQNEHDDHFRKIQWEQFLFARQWHALKTYCNQKGISLIGDIPFYVSYDSADVWANREIFKLDEKGRRKGVAGVPPDAFSSDGQLWGMPVFRWDVLKRSGYQWWIDRLKKNFELFDMVRLDHFRAFSAYWEVSAREETARNGKWIKGPGAQFFKAMKEHFGELPLIAEDLGEIDAPVYQLRDKFLFPGMKVLQFAFGEDVGTSPHSPHNHGVHYLVYTGTHDNNTTRGWWRQDGSASRHYLEQYLGRAVSEDEVPDALCRMAYASVARVAILPVQDVLGLDQVARMNQPAAGAGNWMWRLLPGQINEETERKLKHWTALYNRR